MKPSPLLLTANAVLAILGVAPAKADDMALNFELPEIAQPEPPAPAIAEVAPLPSDGPQPLPIPPGAGSPPMRFHSPQQLPSKVYRQAVAVALSEGATPASILPPAPPQLVPAPVLVAAAPPPEPTAPPPQAASLQAEREDFVLSFDVAPMPAAMVAQAPPQAPADASVLLHSLFDGDTDSLVARAVGNAEGTRTPSGGITAAYFGHTDPGNQVWNMGTFSYQHGATSAAEADQKQLQRLKSQSEVLRKRALKHGLTLTLEETLNGIDLANQSPLAAIGRVGYIERLAEAKLEKGLTGTDAIIVARTRSYINPDTERWNAPGLGNTETSITRDQRRRVEAIARAVEAYRQQQPELDPSTWSLGPDPAIAPSVPAEPQQAEEPADIVLRFWTDGHEPTPQPDLELELGTEPAQGVEAPSRRDRLSETVDRFLGLSLLEQGSEAEELPSEPLSPAEQPAQNASPPAVEPSDLPLQSTEDFQEPVQDPSSAPEATPGRELSPSAELPEPVLDGSPTWAEVREGSQEVVLPTVAAEVANPEPPILEPEAPTPEAPTLEALTPEAPTPEAPTPEAPTPEAPTPETDTTPTSLVADTPPTPEVQAPAAVLGEAPPTAPETVINTPPSLDLDATPGATPEVILHFPSASPVSEGQFADQPFTQSNEDLTLHQGSNQGAGTEPSVVDETPGAEQPKRQKATSEHRLPGAKLLKRSQP